MHCLKIILTSVFIFSIIAACGSGKKAKDMNLKSPEELFSEGNAFYEQGRYDDALKSYETLLVLHPASDLHVESQLQMAEAYAKLDRFEDQMNLLLRVLKENIIPGYVPKIYLQLGRFYERAARFNPGVVSTDTSDYKKALSYYERAIRYEGSDDTQAKAEALYRQGLVQAKMGNLTQATLNYETAAYQYSDKPFAILAKIKLKNPSDTSELSSDEASIKKYLEILGEQPAAVQKDESENEEEEFD